MLRQIYFWILPAIVGLLAATVTGQTQHSADLTVGYMPYPVGPVCPLNVKVTNRSDAAVDSEIQIPLLDGLTVAAPIFSPPNSVIHQVIYAPLPTPPILKSGEHKPLSNIRWISQGGDLDRTEIYGVAQLQTKGVEGNVDTSAPGRVVLFYGDASDSSDAQLTELPESFVALYQNIRNAPTTLAEPGEFGLPRSGAGYDAVSAVVVGSQNLNRLDAAQRDSLLNFVRGGGSLIFACPTQDFDPCNSWIAPYFPVRIVGHRYVKKLTPDQTDPIKFDEPTPISDAEFADDSASVAILRDAHDVLAAYKPLGLGRVIFFALPINSMVDPHVDAGSNVRAQALWTTLLGAQNGMTPFANSKLAGQMPDILASMIGSPTAPWAMAAALALGYVGAVLLLQVFGSGVRRPVAFVIVAGLSALLTITLLAFSVFRQHSNPLAMARIAVCDFSSGGGKAIESVALLGKNIADAKLSPVADGDVLCMASGSTPVQIRGDSMSVDDADVHVGFDRVWQASGFFPAHLTATHYGASATAMFDADGLQLTVLNLLEVPLRNSMLIWDRNAVALGAIASGGASPAVSPQRVLNSDLVVSASTIVSDQDRLRGQIAALLHETKQAGAGAFLANDKPAIPEIDGWVDSPPQLQEGQAIEQLPPLPPGSLIQLSNAPAPIVKAETLVRFPLQLKPSPVGSSVHVDALFSKVDTRPDRNEAKFGMGANFAPYSPETDSIECNFTGDFLIGFAAPPGIGSLRPTHATLLLNPAAPRQTITIRGDQMRDGKIVINPDGRTLGTLVAPVTPATLSFDLTPADCDAMGRVWIDLQVSGSGNISDPMSRRWLIHNPAMSIDSVVTGPPAEFVLPAAPPPEATQPVMMTPPKKVIKKKKPKKPPTTHPSAAPKPAPPKSPPPNSPPGGQP